MIDTYEEKYKGALARCKWLLSEGMISRIAATDLFRELMDNDSENIRKEIINIFHSLAEGKIPVGINYADIFTWLEKQGTSYTKRDVDDAYVEGMAFAKNELEKQGEQKPVDKIKPKFKVGDRIIKFSKTPCPVHSSTDDTICKVAEVHDTCYILNTKEGGIQVPFEWQDHYELVKPAWSEEELTDFEKSLKHVMEETLECGDIHNLKADADLLLRLVKPTDEDMKEALRTEYEKGRADAFAQMQKEWSEEDEKIRQNLMSLLSDMRRHRIEESTYQKYYPWLKSLKDKYTWKPSIAQLNALSIVSKGNAPDDIEAIVSLYNDLKKLTE